jgi:protein-S-isoprenylcysteine O-methyltransferase Ste14
MTPNNGMQPTRKKPCAADAERSPTERQEPLTSRLLHLLPLFLAAWLLWSETMPGLYLDERLFAWAALWRKLRLEERWMIERFGEQYMAYRQRVPALIPFSKWGKS